MASEWALWRRKADEVDAGRCVKPFFAQPAGYMNRHDRRAAAARKRRGARQTLKFVNDTQLPPLAADAGHIESEAPT